MTVYGCSTSPVAVGKDLERGCVTVQMTPQEIAVNFRDAKDRRKQVKILAELNATDTDTIKRILRSEIKDGRLLRCIGKEQEDQTEPAEENKQRFKAVPAKGDTPAWDIVPKEPEPTTAAAEDSIELISRRIRELVTVRDCAEAELRQLRDKLSGLIDTIGGQA